MVATLSTSWGFGPQTAKGSVATTFYKFRVLRAGGGDQTLSEPMPPEAGSDPFVDGVDALGAFGAEQIDMIPRLEDDFGWLLYAMCGAASMTPSLPVATMSTHVFRVASADMLDIPYITTRKVLGAGDDDALWGTQILDCKVQGGIFNFAGASRFSARFSIYGREPSFQDDNSWSWDQGPEGNTSIATSINTVGYFKLPEYMTAVSYTADEIPVNSARITFGNQLTQPQQEFIIGSPYPFAISNLYRSMVIEAVYKWENKDLYAYMRANAGTGASIPWSPVVYESDFRVKMATSAAFVGTTPRSIEFYAQRVFWFPSAPPEVAGVNEVLLPFTGVVARPASGDTFRIEMVNGRTTAYTWPT